MERMGLVSQVEAQLERLISLDLLPADGSLPSEQALARRYGVSRGTLREALLRLSARGLVVQHPGRKTRAVALDEAVTLETLSVALQGKGKAHPDRWRLLEGYFALKREMTVELLAACCEQACSADLDRLEQACFALREAARWNEEGRGWAQQEFDLLRLAARTADRPGHLLLIHSLERTFRSMASWVQSLLDAEAVQEWAMCALYALGEKNPSGLRRELPPLLQACERRLLGNREPTSQPADTHEAHPIPTSGPHRGGETAPVPAGEEPPDTAAPNLSGCRVARNSGSGADSAWSAGGLSTASRSDATEPSPARPPFHICSAQPCCRTASSHASPTGALPPDVPAASTCHEPEQAVLKAGRPTAHDGSGAHTPPSYTALGCAPKAAALLASSYQWVESSLHGGAGQPQVSLRMEIVLQPPLGRCVGSG